MRVLVACEASGTVRSAFRERERERIHYMPPSPDRWRERSKTFDGIASAIADQWGDYADLVTQMEAE